MLYYYIDLQILSLAYIPEINLTSSWCNFFICCLFGFQVFCWGFLLSCSKDILVYNFLFLRCICLIWFKSNTGLIERGGKCSLLFCEKLMKHWNNYSLDSWYNPRVQSGPGVFFVVKFLIITSISLLSINKFKFYIFFLSQFQ